MKATSILVTDDEGPIRLMLRTTLESEGYAISEAADGQEALDAIHRQPPDLVVLDLNMPRVDGLAVLEEMKQIAGARPRVIVLTAYGSIPTAVKATRLGAAAFLEKPVKPTALRQAVQEVLDSPDPNILSDAPESSAGKSQVLERIRESLRMGQFANADALLKQAADQNTKTSAEYFNLLGVLYEARKKWRMARKCYGKAMRTDKTYEPAQLNMRRIYELYTFGRSDQDVVLQDASHGLHYSRSSELPN